MGGGGGGVRGRGEGFGHAGRTGKCQLAKRRSWRRANFADCPVPRQARRAQMSHLQDGRGRPGSQSCHPVKNEDDN